MVFANENDGCYLTPNRRAPLVKLYARARQRLTGRRRCYAQLCTAAPSANCDLHKMFQCQSEPHRISQDIQERSHEPKESVRSDVDDV